MEQLYSIDLFQDFWWFFNAYLTIFSKGEEIPLNTTKKRHLLSKIVNKQ